MKLTGKVIDLICASRDRKAFNEALQQQYEPLYRLAYGWSHHSQTAQDLVQETLLKALENRKNLDNLQHLSAWLSKIMRNLFLDGVRYQRRWQWVEPEEIDRHYCSDCNESELIKRQRNENLYAALGKLPFEQREVILLADLQGFSYQEIADITSAPIGTVMSRISRGRERLKGLLKKQDGHKVVTLRRH